MDGCHLHIGNGIMNIKKSQSRSMLTDIKFQNYKCLDNQAFFFKGINVFCGYNGRGKSSVIQAILMLSQSIDKSNINSLEKLHLNGALVNLGDLDEIFSDISDPTDGSNWKVSFNLGIENTGDPHDITFGYKLEDDFKIGAMCECVIDGEDYFDVVGGNSVINTNTSTRGLNKQLPNYINQLLSRQNVHYISANRRGPVKFEEKKEKPDYYSVGTEGSFTINTMALYPEKVDVRMNVDQQNQQELSLEDAITSWISFIMSGGSVSVQGKNTYGDIGTQKKSSILSLSFHMQNAQKRFFNSYNVGFGYSYILPIIVSALIAKEGNILIVENPEAHLHPEAQVRLTYLLAQLASRGVQVFIETHSEHVVNGLRLAILKKEYKICNDDIRIYFFDEDYSIKPLIVERNGRIKNWPKHFFDQYQNELAEILTLGSKI